MGTTSTRKPRKLHENLLIILACAGVMIGGGLVARAVKPEAKTQDDMDIATVSPSDHQPIKADVINDDPAHFTINVKKIANMNADDNADTFAVYTSTSVPKQCGDFRDLELPYQKPEKYKRVFDLSDHPEVLSAIDHYGCVVMKNIPPSAS